MSVKVMSLEYNYDEKEPLADIVIGMGMCKKKSSQLPGIEPRNSQQWPSFFPTFLLMIKACMWFCMFQAEFMRVLLFIYF